MEALNLGLNVFYPGKGALTKGPCWEPRHSNKRAGICIKQTIPAHKSTSHTLVLATENQKESFI